MKSQIEAVVKDEKKSRDALTEGGKYKLKRNSFVSLDEKGMLKPDIIASEFALIQQKKSKLSAGERSVINQIVFMAMRLAAEKKFRESKAPEQAKEDAPKRRSLAHHERRSLTTKQNDDGRDQTANRAGTDTDGGRA